MKKTVAMLEAEIKRLQELLDHREGFYETLAPTADRLVTCSVCTFNVLPEGIIFLADSRYGQLPLCSEECLERVNVNFRKREGGR